MSLNNGLGDVIEADVPVYDYSYEGLCAIRHANETDYWILINQDTTGIGVYSVTSQGVDLSSVYELENAGFGTIKASPSPPDISIPCCDKVYAGGSLFNFDRFTGALSNPEVLHAQGGEAVEFSTNSYYLFSSLTNGATGQQQLVRYNLVQSFVSGVNVGSTEEVVAENVSAVYMQMAPDQKIYYTSLDAIGGTIALGTINCVNSDEIPDVTPSVFSYDFGGGETAFLTLPNYPAWIFYESYFDNVEFGPDTVYLCAGDSIILDAGVGDYWEWGGDCYSGPESTWPDNSTRYFTVTQPGTYVACVNGPCSSGAGADGCDSSDQITVLPCTITQPPCDLLDLPTSISICAGDTVQLVADLSLFESYTGLQWLGGGTFIPYDTVAQPLYVPSAQEIAAGSANVTLQVFTQEIAGAGGNFLAYDHSGDDIIFYTNTIDGSVNVIQSNTGNDWTAMGFRTSNNTLYGISNIVTLPALSSVNLGTGEVTPIFTYPNNQFYAGDYDNTHDKFYAIGISEVNNGELLEQTLYTIDINTGALTTVGDLSLFATDGFFVANGDGINGLAYDPSMDKLWATTASGQFLSINPSTAEVNTIGNTVGDLRGLAYDYIANELWGIAANGTLYHIDTTSGETIEVVPSAEPLSFVTTLTYAIPQDSSESICSDNTTIIINNANALDLGDDATLCEGETLTLSAPGFESYAWQDGSTGETFVADESGTYSVEVTDGTGCTFSDVITITVIEAPNGSYTASPQPTTTNDTEITFTLTDADEGLSYSWSFEDGTPETSNALNPTVLFPPIPGLYSVSLNIENESGCISTLSTSIVIESDGEITLPNIFTPNGDGDNDRFVPFQEFPGRWTLTIFNRWGGEVFSTENLSQGWNGDGLPSATYYWVLQPRDGQQGERRAGYVTLVRD
jgi:gliding motility-associated-like protein